MEVYIERTGERKDIKFNGTVDYLLDILGLSKESVFVECNGSIVIEEDRLKDSDKVTIHSVVSGG